MFVIDICEDCILFDKDLNVLLVYDATHDANFGEVNLLNKKWLSDIIR